MSGYNLAVVGATGAVGRQMIQLLAERSFPIKKLKLLASERSAGTELSFKDDHITVELVKEGIFKDVDIALFSAGEKASQQFAPQAVQECAIVIDNSNAFRMNPDVPLVIPEVNPADIAKQQGIIANPNCSTIQLLVALKPIYDAAGIGRINVSTYQAVSGSGKKAIDELTQQIKQYLNNQVIEKSVYPYQIAFNVIPQINVFEDNAYTREEMKMHNESRKIFHDQQLLVNATCARVPVFYGHSEAVNIETRREITIPEVKKLLNQAAAVELIDDIDSLRYPLAIDSVKTDQILVGRLRKDISHPHGINLWIVGHNLRKGAALNTIQIAEKLINK